jgi:hypothetical protein
MLNRRSIACIDRVKLIEDFDVKTTYLLQATDFVCDVDDAALCCW